jgi:hypothetical protein
MASCFLQPGTGYWERWPSVAARAVKHWWPPQEKPSHPSESTSSENAANASYSWMETQFHLKYSKENALCYGTGELRSDLGRRVTDSLLDVPHPASPVTSAPRPRAMLSAVQIVQVVAALCALQTGNIISTEDLPS